MSRLLDPHLWRRLKPLFEAASNLPADRQAGFVDAHCSEDPVLHQRLSALLAAHRDCSEILDRSLPERLARLLPGAPEPRNSEPLIGTLLNARYLVEREIGRGGLSVIYVAQDRVMLGRPAAVKVLLGREVLPGALDNELAALSPLHHPCIAIPKDVGMTPAGNRFLVLEYVDGPSLRQACSEGPLDRERVSRMILALGSALESAHFAGVWHLDLKPENILLNAARSPGESPVIVDFGIAHIRGHNEVAAAAGSLAYMAPEQFAGAPCAASDQYSLALIAVEMLSGHAPQRMPSASLPSFENCPQAAIRVLTRALAADPSARFSSISDFTTALGKALSPAPRNRLFLALTTAAALLIVGLSGAYAWRAKQDENRVIEANFRLLRGQLAVLAAANISTSVPSAQTLSAIRATLESLHPLIMQGHREDELLAAVSTGLKEVGLLSAHPARRSLGMSNQGVEALRHSAAIAAILRRADPMEPKWNSFSAELYSGLATVLNELGRTDEAHEAVQIGLNLLNLSASLSSIPEAESRELLSQKAGLYIAWSRVETTRDNFTEALRLRDQAIRWQRSILEGELSYAERRRRLTDLASTLATRGYLLGDLGRHWDSLADYGESSCIVSSLLQDDPSNIAHHWHQARNEFKTGRTLALAGRYAEAAVRLDASLAAMRVLSKDAPQDVSALRSTALTLSWLALVKSRLQTPPARLARLVEEAISLNAKVRTVDPENAKVRDETVAILQNALQARIPLPQEVH